MTSEKSDVNYLKPIRYPDNQPDELVMVGNSFKSDILPVLNVGGYGVRMPYHFTWAHEHIEHSIDDEKFKSVEGIRDILGFL